MKHTWQIAVLTIAFASSSLAKQLPPYQPVTNDIAVKYYLYAAMASSAYEGAGNHFPIERLGWQKISWKTGLPIESVKPSYSAKEYVIFGSGFAFDIWQKINSNEIVFAFRGTDKPDDWIKSNIIIPISVSYKSAKKKLREFIHKFPDKKVIALTGHSLGGGIALSCSCDQGIEAIVFDPSPRIFDGLGDNIREANRVSIHQKGEALEPMRRVSTKFPDVISSMYESDYRFPDNVSPHSVYYLALFILRQAGISDPNSAALLDGR